MSQGEEPLIFADISVYVRQVGADISGYVRGRDPFRVAMEKISGCTWMEVDGSGCGLGAGQFFFLGRGGGGAELQGLPR